MLKVTSDKQPCEQKPAWFGHKDPAAITAQVELAVTGE
jgi:hypothetical protein